MNNIKTVLINDNFQNYKRYAIPKAQLVIADIPYNLGVNFYGSNPSWYVGGDNKNGESKLAKKAAFNTDYSFNIAEYMHFCSKLLKPEPKEKGKSPAMIVFCSFEQMPTIIEYGKKHGFSNSYPLFFIKKTSPQVLKANMKIVGATEHAVVLYRDKLPKFNNGRQIGENGKPIRGTGKMKLNWFNWEKDSKDIPKIHPTQKPVSVLKQLIEIFTDEGDVVIDPCAGSGTTLRACKELNRHSYGFEISKEFYKKSNEKMLSFDELKYIKNNESNSVKDGDVQSDIFNTTLEETLTKYLDLKENDNVFSESISELQNKVSDKQIVSLEYLEMFYDIVTEKILNAVQ